MKMKKIMIVLFVFITSLSFGEDLVSINSVGDILMGSMFPNKVLPPKDGKTLFKWVKKYLTSENANIILGNLEGAVTSLPNSKSRKRYVPKRSYSFRMPPRYMKHLKDAGFNVLTTANNHAYDFGWEGARDTRKHLKKHGFKYTGNKDEVAYMDVNGIKVGIIGFSTYYKFGHNSILKVKKSMALIRKASKTCDVLVITFHGGTEGEKALHIKNKFEYLWSDPRGNVMEFSRKAIDNGADLVVGHGPHVPRAMEVYKDRLIAYSLGNFCTYTMSAKGHKKYSLILNAKFNKQGKFVVGKIIPIMQYTNWPLTAIPYYDKKGRSIKLIRKLSYGDIKNNLIHIADDGTITKKSLQAKK